MCRPAGHAWAPSLWFYGFSMTVFEPHEVFLHVYWVARPRSIAGSLSVHMDVTELLSRD